MSRWNRCHDNPPTKNGRYWVYPYVNLTGHRMVSMATFQDGHWDSYRPQEFTHWKRVDVPDPPKGKDEEFTNTRNLDADELLRDLRKNPDRGR